MDNQILIEASAGCGKTYKIEEMLVELLEEGVELNEIVIVTFTSAQAKDLKKRIYNRLKRTPGKRIERSFKLFDEANISTLHSFAQKVIQEAGVIVDFHVEEITSLIDFKRSFKSILRHEINPLKIGNLQLAKVCNNQNLLKNVHSHFGKQIEEVIPYSEWLDKLAEAREKIPFSYDEIKNDFEILQKCYLKKGTDSITQFIEIFKSDKWGEKELGILVKQGVQWGKVFRPETLRKKIPEDITPPSLEKYICFETHLKPIAEGVCNTENIELAIAKHCQEHRDTLPKEIVVYDDLIRILDVESQKPEFLAFFKSRYKVAIIDEFQDTDALQWKIFRKLFDRFYLVGDPKQAIYGFRKADIYTYLEAYNAIENKQTLNTNYRSDPSLIQKLNKLFLSAQKLFLLPATNQSLEYPPVQAGKQGDKGKLVVIECQKNSELYPLISHLVSTDPKEWAILVRGHKEALKISSFLNDCQIPYIIQRQSSMAESEAGRSFYQIYEGIYSKKRIRSALLSPLINYSAKEIAKLENLDEFEIEIARFERYREKIDSSFGEFVNAFESDFGERIASSPPLFYEWEALQEEIFEWLKEHELEDFFKEANENKDKRFVGSPDGVKIMTIHTSKGLEFEKVFVLGATETYGILDEEELAEMMRLLYVALTRAKTELYIPVLFGKKNMMNQFFSKIDSNFSSDNLPDWVSSIGGEMIKADRELKPIQFRLTETRDPVLLSRSFKPLWVQSYTRLKEKKKRTSISQETVLPKGVEMGICLHGLLECIEFKLPVEISLKNSPFQPYENEIQSLLNNVMDKVEIGGIKLKDLSGYKQMREVPFTYTSENGFTTGAIDLVIEVNGKIYIVDWKSHALEDYSFETLSNVVREESFDLQARIYKEAVERSIGPVQEVLFVFVRGPGVYRWIP